MGEPERSGLPDVRDVEPERGAVADRRLDRRRGVSDDDADLGDAGVADRLQAIEQHRLVGDRHKLFGRSMRDRAQPRPRAPGQDEGFHDAERSASGLQTGNPAARNRPPLMSSIPR